VGDMLAIVLTSSSSGGWWMWSTHSGDPPPDIYTGGDNFLRFDTGTWFRSFSTSDMNFKTFVDPMRVPMPEPSLLALLACGAGFVILRRRR